MLNYVEAYNTPRGYAGRFNVLRLTGEYLLRGIRGIGPMNAGILSMDMAIDDGNLYSGYQIGSRNIVLTIAYKPDYSKNSSIASLRENVYRTFNPHSEVTLEFAKSNGTGQDIYVIKGRVESNDPDIFSKDPSSVISIICPDPFFTIKNELKSIVNNMQSKTQFNFQYESVPPVGIQVRAKVIADTQSFKMTLNGTSPFIDINNADFKAGQEIQVSSERTNRYIRKLLNSTTYTNILGYLTAGSLTEFKIQQGTNYVYVYPQGKIGDVTIIYTPKYGSL